MNTVILPTLLAVEQAHDFAEGLRFLSYLDVVRVLRITGPTGFDPARVYPRKSDLCWYVAGRVVVALGGAA